MRQRIKALATLALLVTVIAACGGGGVATTGGEPAATTAAPAETTAAPAETTAAPEVTTGELTPVRLQLQWVTQAQFAGYFAAIEQGFYTDEGLDVTILEGAVDIVPQQVLASGGAEFGLAWVPKALVSREEGANIVNIGQVFQRSGTLEVSWADLGITEPADWEGKKVGTWGFGNEFELTAAFEKFGVTPGEVVQQPFDMSLLLNREIDAAQAMTYNEYAQVLEAVNPDTGALYTPEDLSVIDFNDIGTAMLQDAIWVDAGWLESNSEVAGAFLRASFRGWIFCRDDPDACVQIVLDRGSALGGSHQAWQMNEINALIWPSPGGIGVMDKALWDQTVEVAVGQRVISAEPGPDAYRTDLAEEAIAALEAEGLDVTGEGFSKTAVVLNEGGE
ncbi:MAG: ABC transporter substrate-binding protein [Actinomycetota bacterium]